MCQTDPDIFFMTCFLNMLAKNQLSIKVKKMQKVKKVQIQEYFAYEIHSLLALVDAEPAFISRNLLHRYIEPVTDI